MISMHKIKRIFNAKLQTTNSLDDALKKACWVSYKQGLEDAKRDHSGPKFQRRGVNQK